LHLKSEGFSFAAAMQSVQKPYPWGNDRRYNSYADYFKRIFGGRVQKISVDAGFTCPNRDGSIAEGGCSFCDNDAFHPSYCLPSKGISQQISEGIEFHRKRYRRAKQFLVYFQAFSNTYAPVERLELLYKEALSHPMVAGLVIGTRPDTIDDEKLDMLSQLQKQAYMMIEYGVETLHDESLLKINRGHDAACARDAIHRTHKAGIPCGAHFMLGLPGESREVMLSMADQIAALPLTTVKFHQLQLFKGTKMALEYLLNPSEFQLFTIESYIQLVVDIAERLPPEFVIERFAGEVPPRFLVSPLWGNLRYDAILQMIENEFERRNSYQGMRHPTLADLSNSID